MVKNLSAVKRNQIALRNKRRNKYYRSTIKTLMKKVFISMHYSSDNKRIAENTELQLLVSQTYSQIDKAVKRGIMHKNNAARKKSRLANSLKMY